MIELASTRPSSSPSPGVARLQENLRRNSVTARAAAPSDAQFPGLTSIAGAFRRLKMQVNAQPVAQLLAEGPPREGIVAVRQRLDNPNRTCQLPAGSRRDKATPSCSRTPASARPPRTAAPAPVPQPHGWCRHRSDPRIHPTGRQDTGTGSGPEARHRQADVPADRELQHGGCTAQIATRMYVTIVNFSMARVRPRSPRGGTSRS
jgi:hypothetical protein